MQAGRCYMAFGLFSEFRMQAGAAPADGMAYLRDGRGSSLGMCSEEGGRNIEDYMNHSNAERRK